MSLEAGNACSHRECGRVGISKDGVWECTPVLKPAGRSHGMTASWVQVAVGLTPHRVQNVGKSTRAHLDM